MRKLLSRLGIWLICSVCILSAPVAIAQQSELTARLQASENGVRFVLSNNSARTLSVLRWETPLEEELTQDLFDVAPSASGKRSHFAERAKFSGRLIKRGNPEPKDYIQIKAGESVSATIALSDYYQLESDGLHTVSFDGVFEVQPDALNFSSYKRFDNHKRTMRCLHGDHKVLGVSTETVAVQLTSAPEPAYARVGSYNSCSVAQQSQLASDIEAAEVITKEARIAMESLPGYQRATSPRYLQWFGEYDAARYDTVLDIYRKAEQVMADGSVEFNCGCNEQYFAYVFPLDPFKVYLCTFYWTASQTGTDSRAGTILHELSHFPEVGDTNDNAYGTFSVSNLAVENPSLAVNNADSIEYFAENTPFREISDGQPPPAPIQYITLQPGGALTGVVESNEYVYYQVSNADYIELTTLVGDADLAVYSTAARVEQLCSSFVTGGADRCELPETSAAYIEVIGSSDSRFTIAAGRNVDPVFSETLVLGETQTRSVITGQSQYYTVTGAGVVEINSLSGDADLIVHSSESRTSESQVCESQNLRANSLVDSCPVNAGTAYITVFGFSTAQYEISTRASDAGQTVVQPAGNTGGTITDNGDSTGNNVANAGVVVTGGNGGGQFSGWFVVSLALLGLRRRRGLSVLGKFGAAQ